MIGVKAVRGFDSRSPESGKPEIFMNREPADKIKVSPLYASFVISPGEKSPSDKIGFIVDKNME